MKILFLYFQGKSLSLELENANFLRKIRHKNKVGRLKNHSSVPFQTVSDKAAEEFQAITENSP